jgi:hypothetical protein
MTHRDTETRGYGNTATLAGVAPPGASRDKRPKRLTLDLAPELHRALKRRAVELDIPMADLLRALIQRALAEPSTLSNLADDIRRT